VFSASGVMFKRSDIKSTVKAENVDTKGYDEIMSPILFTKHGKEAKNTVLK
jgi:hypothetical protein